MRLIVVALEITVPLALSWAHFDRGDMPRRPGRNGYGEQIPGSHAQEEMQFREASQTSQRREMKVKPASTRWFEVVATKRLSVKGGVGTGLVIRFKLGLCDQQKDYGKEFHQMLTSTDLDEEPPAKRPALSAAEEEQVSRYDALNVRQGRGGLGLGTEPVDESMGASSTSGGGGEARSVASHYNSLADRHRTLDSGSDILYVRNLHNWIKAVLIGRHIKRGCSVLDLACGKGGDMLKFRAGGCASYVGIDVAAQSVRDAVSRYNGSHGRGGPHSIARHKLMRHTTVRTAAARPRCAMLCHAMLCYAMLSRWTAVRRPLYRGRLLRPSARRRAA